MPFAYYPRILSSEAPNLSNLEPIESLVEVTAIPPTNSGLAPNFTYFNSTTPVFLSSTKSGQTILEPVVKSSISFVNSNNNQYGSISYSPTQPNMVIGGNNGIHIDPNGSGFQGGEIFITAPSNEYAIIGPSNVNETQLFVAASQPVNNINEPGGETFEIGRNCAGQINLVKVTTAGLLRLQFDLQPGQDMLPNTMVTFLLDPTSVGTVEFGDEGTTIAGPFTPSNAGAGKIYRVDIFTPDGNTYYAINQQ